jgi:hypothetical protein
MPAFIDAPTGEIADWSFRILGWVAASHEDEPVTLDVNGRKVTPHLHESRPLTAALPGFGYVRGVAAIVNLLDVVPPGTAGAPAPSLKVTLGVGDESISREAPVGAGLWRSTQQQLLLRDQARAWCLPRLRCPLCRNDKSDLSVDADRDARRRHRDEARPLRRRDGRLPQHGPPAPPRVSVRTAFWSIMARKSPKVRILSISSGSKIKPNRFSTARITQAILTESQPAISVSRVSGARSRLSSPSSERKIALSSQLSSGIVSILCASYGISAPCGANELLELCGVNPLVNPIFDLWNFTRTS